jgi:hypothetical protein
MHGKTRPPIFPTALCRVPKAVVWYFLEMGKWKFVHRKVVLGPAARELNTTA